MRLLRARVICVDREQQLFALLRIELQCGRFGLVQRL